MNVFDENRLNRKQVAAFLKVSTKTVGNWLKSGKLPEAQKLGSIEYWTEGQLEQWHREQNPHLANAANQVVSSVAPELAAQ